MGLLSQRRAIDAASFGIDVDPFGTPSKSGVRVNFVKVIGLATAWSCATLIADTVYTLPVDTFRKNSDRSVEEVPSPLVVTDPSPIVTARESRAQAVISMAFWGNSYGAALGRDNYQYLTGVNWFDPDSVQVTEKSQLHAPTYAVNGVEISDMVHLRRHMRPGSAVGLSPLERQKETFGLAIAARDFASQWFAGGAHPTGVLTTDKPIDEPKAKLAKERFMASIRGKREPVALGDGWKFEPIQLSPRDSDLAALGADAAIAVCQAFRVQPEMVGLATSGSSVTYANREQRSIDFLTFTIQPWLTIFEDFWTANQPTDVFSRFNTGALLRSDLKTRYQVHDLAIRMGLSSVNERRALEDFAAVEDRDELLWPPYRGFPIDKDEE